MEYIKDPYLVLDLPLYRLDGSSFMSKDAYGHLCGVSGAAWVLRGRDFDGIDDYVEVSHDASQLLTIGGSIEAWIRPVTSGENNSGRIVDKSSSSNAVDGYCVMTYTSGGFSYVGGWINNGILRLSGAGDIALGSWNHIVVTWDNTGYVTCYVNGSQSGTPGVSADPAGITTTTSLYIGNRSALTTTFNGSIAEVRIYSRVLTSQEILRAYLAAKWRYR